jgi:hypothetical protein
MVKTIIIVAEKTPVAVGSSNFYVKKNTYNAADMDLRSDSAWPFFRTGPW